MGKRRESSRWVETTIKAESGRDLEAARKQRDLERAMTEVGPTPQRRAAWLVETFLTTDPRELSTGEHIWREHQTMAFVMLAMTDPKISLDKASLTMGSGGTFGDANLRLIWSDVRDRVTRWADGKEVPLPASKGVATRRAGTGKDLRCEIRRTAEGADAFVVAVFDLLSHPSVRVRKCDRCGQFFVPIRRQERHPACARAHHDQVWNAKRSKTRTKGEESTNG
jgi:hypothetical protein